MDQPDLTAEEVADKAMNIAADMCVHTNDKFLTMSLAAEEEKNDDERKE